MDSVRRCSPASLILGVLCAGFAVVAGYAYYQAFGPLHRELVAILGGFGLPLAAVSLWLARRRTGRGNGADVR